LSMLLHIMWALYKQETLMQVVKCRDAQFRSRREER
jgi:hypothetical protein